MTAAELLADLRSRGFSLSISDGGSQKLRVSPASALDDADRADIAANRPEFLSLLADEADLALAQAAIFKVFPRAKFLGVHPIGTFEGPMTPLPARAPCRKCGGTRHWRKVEGKLVCALCADGGPAEILGDRFLAALNRTRRK